MSKNYNAPYHKLSIQMKTGIINPSAHYTGHLFYDTLKSDKSLRNIVITKDNGSHIYCYFVINLKKELSFSKKRYSCCC